LKGKPRYIWGFFQGEQESSPSFERLPSPGRSSRAAKKIALQQRLRCMALLAESSPASQVAWFKTSFFRDPSKHLGADFLAIMERKDIVRIIIMLKRPM
jgi:hypothetical protein